MNKLIKLESIIENENIEVMNFSCDKSGSMSLLSNSGHCYIGIDNSLPKGEYTIRLAHEIGHCVKGAFYNIYSPFDIIEKHENRANKWAFKELVPQSELNLAVSSGYTEIWQLSEYFSLPEHFILQAIQYYKSIDNI